MEDGIGLSESTAIRNRSPAGVTPQNDSLIDRILRLRATIPGSPCGAEQTHDPVIRPSSGGTDGDDLLSIRMEPVTIIVGGGSVDVPREQKYPVDEVSGSDIWRAIQVGGRRYWEMRRCMESTSGRRGREPE